MKIKFLDGSNRYKVHFSLGGYVIVRALDRKHAEDICIPMLSDGEHIERVEQIA